MASEPQSANKPDQAGDIRCTCGWKGPIGTEHACGHPNVIRSKAQSAPQTIPEVLSTIEQRQFWERMYLSCIESERPLASGANYATLADSALAAWCERFAKVAE